MTPHDNAYKNLFTHPQVVRDFLRGFVSEEWVGELDLNTLEKASGSYVTDDLRDREDDIIWRVRRNNHWCYIYLLLEFQSKNDPWMAVRIMTYIGLLYQDLIKRGEVVSPQRLPPVFPAVIYNGIQSWTSARELETLIEPAPSGLMRYVPRQRYFVLDEGRQEILEENNTFSDIVALEQGPGPEALAQVLARLTARLQAPENSELRRALTVWIHRVVLKKLIPGTEIPPVNELKEIESMLAERVVEWTETWKQQGMQQGMQKGMQQGEAAVLQRLLARRFGPLSEQTCQRLRQASLEQLETWADRFLDAHSIDEVFRDR